MAESMIPKPQPTNPFLQGEREEVKPVTTSITWKGLHAGALRTAAYNLSMTPNQFVRRAVEEKLRGIGMLP